MKTLLITARPQTRQLLSEALKRRRHETTVVEDADAACAAFQSADYRLAIVETDGPPGQGVLLCRRLRAISRDGHCLILAAGQARQPEQIEALLAAGADDYLTDLDDAQRLEVRLTVAEYRLDRLDGRRSGQETQQAAQKSGDEFQQIFSTVSDAILVLDAETLWLVDVNQAALQLYGYSREEFLNLSYPAVTAEPQQSAASIEQALAGKLTRVPLRYHRKKDGTVFPVEISAGILVLGGRKMLCGVIRDITQRIRAEEVLRQSEERLRKVLENMPVMLDAFDQDGNIVIWNHECERITGYRAEEIVGNPQAMQRLYPDDGYRKRMMEQWRLRGHDYRDWEWQVTCKDGSTRTVAWSNISRQFPVPGWATWGVGVDVTKREEVIGQLRESEAKYRLIADNVTDVIWTAALEGLDDLAGRLEDQQPAPAGGGGYVHTPYPPSTRREVEMPLRSEADKVMQQWRFTYVSPSVERFLGYDAEEVMTLKLQDLLAAESYADAQITLAEELAAERQEPGEHGRRTVEVKHRHKDGSVRWGEVRTTFLRDEQMRLVGLLGVSRDITERKQAEEALRKSEAKLRTLLENLPDFVLTVDRHATIEFANHGTPGATVQELLGANGFSFVVPEHQHSCRAAFHQAMATHQPQTVEVLDIFGYWWACGLVPMIEEGEARHMIVICTDVTEQRKAAQALHKEQQLLRHLLDLHERDRQLTAYEIHDGFSQYLTGALYNLQAYGELQSTKPPEARKAFDTGLALIRRSISEARRLISGLRPPILDESGIVAAIDYLACETQQSREAEVQFIHDVQFQRLASPLESAIFRIVQESLTNARRHSQSAKIRIELLQRDNRIHVGVRDWGVGFNPAKVEEGRFGLQGIRERARLFGGQVTIETAPQEGTYLRVELPLIEAAREVSPP